MKSWVKVVLLSLISGSALAQTTILDTISIGGLKRAYRYYIPASYQTGTPAPLVFNFHGLNSTAQIQENYGDFRPIADTAGFIIVHPQGLSLSGTTGWFSFWTVLQAQADLAFANAILDTLSRRLSLDPERFYSTGMSNGGFMTYDIACFMNQRFAAIASVTGTMVPEHLSQCQPGRAVPVLHFHGTIDATVPYSGIGGTLPFVPVDSLIQFWVNNNGCNPIPLVQSLPNINVQDNSTVIRYTWDQGYGGSVVELYKVIGGGHTWPGSAFSSPTSVTNLDINASQLIWTFFTKFRKTAVVKVSRIESTPLFKIWTDLVQNKLKITWSDDKEIVINLMDLNGNYLEKVKVNRGTTEVDISHWPAGVYFYHFNENQYQSIGKLIKW